MWAFWSVAARGALSELTHQAALGFLESKEHVLRADWLGFATARSLERLCVTRQAENVTSLTELHSNLQRTKKSRAAAPAGRPGLTDE
jgi:hypothetical protein